MKLFNFEKKKEKIKSLVYTPISEKLKGLVKSEKIKFPKALGEAHPFDFQYMEQLTKRYGIVSAIVDKYVDFIMSGGISIKSDDDRALKIINDFMRDNSFDTLIRQWLREALIKNGFMELGTDAEQGINGIKVLDSSYIYVDRDDEGNVLGYNQFTKPLQDWTQQSTKDIEPFKPSEIAHLSFNKYGDCAYGMGLVAAISSFVNDLIGSRKELHTIMERKASNPLIFLMGDRTKDEYPDESAMTGLGQNLETLSNKTNWVLSDYVKPMTVDFGNVGDKFKFVIDDDTEKVFAAAQVPAVLMGLGNIPEGLASVQMRAWLLRIQSFREETEKVIEEKIFKVVLNSQGIDSHVEIVWGLPSQEEKDTSSKVLIEAIKNPFLPESLREKLSGKLAENFGIDPEEIETSEEERKKEEEDDKQPIVPLKKEHLEERYSAKEIEYFNNLQISEWVNFNYKRYNDDVLDVTNSYDFEFLNQVQKQI